MTGWPLKRLENVADVRAGLQVSSKRRTNPLSVPYLRVANVFRERLELSHVRSMRVTAKEAERTRLLKGDLLIVEGHGNIHEIGRCAVWDESIPGCVHQNHLIRARPNETLIHSEYLSRYLNSPGGRNQMRRLSKTTSGLNTISTSNVREIRVPVPSKREQRRIIAILDQTDAICRKRQEAIVLTEELRRSAFLTIFGDPVTNPMSWPIVPLAQLASIKSGVTKGRKIENKKTVSVPYLRVANVQDGVIDTKEVKIIDVLPSDVDKYRLISGDVLLTEGGDPDKLGRGGVWRGEIAPCIHQNHVFRVRCQSSAILPEFLSALTGSTYGKRYFLKAAKQTTGIASINKTQLQAFPVLVPSQARQERYLSVLQAIEKRRADLRTASLELGNLFHSLIQRAFRGEL